MRSRLLPTLCDVWLEINTIYASRSGITIHLQDEWDDLMNHVIPAIHEHYLKFANARLR